MLTGQRQSHSIIICTCILFNKMLSMLTNLRQTAKFALINDNSIFYKICNKFLHVENDHIM